MTWPTADTIKTAMRDGTGLAAVGAIAYGAWLIYPPAGFIVGGLIVLAGIIQLARA